MCRDVDFGRGDQGPEAHAPSLVILGISIDGINGLELIKDKIKLSSSGELLDFAVASNPAGASGLAPAGAA